MSKVKDLPELSALADDDFLYVVDASVGANAGRKTKSSTVKTFVQPTASEVKTLYESNTNTNAFTDAEKTKLAAVDLNGPLFVSAGIGLVADYTAGNYRYGDTFFAVPAGAIVLAANITNGRIYVDIDGTVKQTGSGILPPLHTLSIAAFNTGPSAITSILDRRVTIVPKLLVDGHDSAIGVADDTTISTTDVLIANMSKTPPVGNYLVHFSGSVVNSANGSERGFVSLWTNNGSSPAQIAGTERSFGTSGGAYVPIGTQTIITLDGATAIEARWRAVAGTNTIRAARSMRLVKLP